MDSRPPTDRDTGNHVSVDLGNFNQFLIKEITRTDLTPNQTNPNTDLVWNHDVWEIHHISGSTRLLRAMPTDASADGENT